jgi:4'-phosphopantetheinyl transferase EntD
MGENKEKMLNAINKNTVIFSAKESSYESLIALTKNLL